MNPKYSVDSCYSGKLCKILYKNSGPKPIKFRLKTATITTEIRNNTPQSFLIDNLAKESDKKTRKNYSVFDLSLTVKNPNPFTIPETIHEDHEDLEEKPNSNCTSPSCKVFNECFQVLRTATSQDQSKYLSNCINILCENSN